MEGNLYLNKEKFYMYKTITLLLVLCQTSVIAKMNNLTFTNLESLEGLSKPLMVKEINVQKEQISKLRDIYAKNNKSIEKVFNIIIKEKPVAIITYSISDSRIFRTVIVTENLLLIFKGNSDKINFKEFYSYRMSINQKKLFLSLKQYLSSHKHELLEFKGDFSHPGKGTTTFMLSLPNRNEYHSFVIDNIGYFQNKNIVYKIYYMIKEICETFNDDEESMNMS